MNNEWTFVKITFLGPEVHYKKEVPKMKIKKIYCNIKTHKTNVWYHMKKCFDLTYFFFSLSGTFQLCHLNLSFTTRFREERVDNEHFLDYISFNENRMRLIFQSLEAKIVIFVSNFFFRSQ